MIPQLLYYYTHQAWVDCERNVYNHDVIYYSMTKSTTSRRVSLYYPLAWKKREDLFGTPAITHLNKQEEPELFQLIKRSFLSSLLFWLYSPNHIRRSRHADFAHKLATLTHTSLCSSLLELDQPKKLSDASTSRTTTKRTKSKRKKRVTDWSDGDNPLGEPHAVPMYARSPTSIEQFKLLTFTLKRGGGKSKQANRSVVCCRNRTAKGNGGSGAFLGKRIRKVLKSRRVNERTNVGKDHIFYIHGALLLYQFPPLAPSHYYRLHSTKLAEQQADLVRIRAWTR